MNRDILEGKWRQIRGQARVWWGELTDDELDRATGRLEVLIGLMQEKYGYSRKDAADEIITRVAEYESSLKRDRVSALN